MIKNLIVKVNNISSEDVRVVSEPIIIWDFDTVDVVSVENGEVQEYHKANQKSFNIRISNSDNNLGTDSFSGNIVDENIISGIKRYKVEKDLIIRGTKYFCQLRVTDELDNVSGWTIFKFTFNSSPSVSNVKIEPENPYAYHDLMLNYLLHDEDGDDETGSIIRWYRNGEHQKYLDNSIVVDSSYLNYGDLWVADIIPSDGYELGKRITSDYVKISGSLPVVSNLKIYPELPNENDILKADYESSFDDDNSEIRWYVNGIRHTGSDNNKYARLDMSPGDTVHFEIIPHDGTSSGHAVSSNHVVVSGGGISVTDVLIDGQKNPLSLLSRSPYISWKINKPKNSEIYKTNIRIGSAPGANNIYSTVIEGELNNFTVPRGVLKRGRDYFLSISASDSDEFDNFSISHFRLSGSHWNSSVSNEKGWTIEINYLIEEEGKNQSIVIQDGERYCEVRISKNSIGFSSDEIIEKEINPLNKFRTLTIVGKENDVKIYLDREIIIDASGKLIKEDNNKKLEIGYIYNESNQSDSFEVKYRSIMYTTEGDFYPGDSEEYGDVYFHSVTNFKNNEAGAIKEILDNKYLIAVNPYSGNEGGSIYKLSSGESERYSSINESLNPIKSISLSPSGRRASFSHNNGLSIFSSYYISNFDYEIDFIDVDDLPDDNGWILKQNIGRNVASVDGNGLRVDNFS